MRGLNASPPPEGGDVVCKPISKRDVIISAMRDAKTMLFNVDRKSAPPALIQFSVDVLKAVQVVQYENQRRAGAELAGLITDVRSWHAGAPLSLAQMNDVLDDIMATECGGFNIMASQKDEMAALRDQGDDKGMINFNRICVIQSSVADKNGLFTKIMEVMELSSGCPSSAQAVNIPELPTDAYPLPIHLRYGPLARLELEPMSQGLFEEWAEDVRRKAELRKAADSGEQEEANDEGNSSSSEDEFGGVDDDNDDEGDEGDDALAAAAPAATTPVPAAADDSAQNASAVENLHAVIRRIEDGDDSLKKVYDELVVELQKWALENPCAGISQSDFNQILQCPVWAIIGELQCLSPTFLLERLQTTTQIEHHAQDRPFELVLLPKWTLCRLIGDDHDDQLKNMRIEHALKMNMVS